MGGGSFTYDYGFRIYNPALGKFLSVDPLTLSYPWYTPYQFAGNKPIESIDLDGMEELSTKEVTSRLWYGEPEIKKKSEWHWDNIVDNPDGLHSQFARASKCNKMHSGAALYKNVAEKHAYYIWCQAYIDNKKNGGGSQWFGAAAHVTGVLGVGGAEYPDGGFFTSDATDKFLIGGNEYLFGKNMNNMKGLMNGSLALDFIAADGKKVTTKGKSGKSLDYALVEFEQSKVQEYIDSYQKSNPKADMKAIFKEINNSMNYATCEVQNAIENNFPKDKNGNSTFEFSKYEHRVILGRKLIDKFHEDKKSSN